ncbi:MAG: hypothetical protein IKK73_05365 [Akkermansia sp.]|nr:hypothetical protein [Akkermansia sp.]
MKYLQTCLLGLVVSPIAIASADTRLPAPIEKAFSAYTSLPSVLVPVLQQAQDKDSATSAAKVLQAKFPAICEARQKIKDMPQLTPEQNQQIRLQFGQRMREEWAKMYYEIERLRLNRCFQSDEMRDAFRLMCLMIEK